MAQYCWLIRDQSLLSVNSKLWCFIESWFLKLKKGQNDGRVGNAAYSWYSQASWIQFLNYVKNFVYIWILSMQYPA